MLRDFIAIDFETANQEPSSVCSVGVIMVREGQIVDSFYSLIQPEPNYYNYWCQRVHGISQDDTDDAPVFSKVWQQLEERIVEVYYSDQEIDDIRYQIATIPFVAHNARFDEGCLKAVFKVYQMDYPDYRFYDTLYQRTVESRYRQVPQSDSGFVSHQEDGIVTCWCCHTARIVRCHSDGI